MSEVKQPIFDVIVLVLTMAILDDAFSANIHSVEDVFMARVSPPRRSVRLKFKKDKLNVPICRQPDSYYSGMTTHPMKPLRYHTYLYYLQRLSLSVGMIRAMKPYDLRRGTGEAVDSEFDAVGHGDFPRTNIQNLFRNRIPSLATASNGPCLCQHISEIYERKGSDPCSGFIPWNSLGRRIDEHP